MYRNSIFKTILFLCLYSPYLILSQTQNIQKSSENKSNSNSGNKKSDSNKSSRSLKPDRNSKSERDSSQNNNSKVQMITTKQTKDTTVKGKSSKKITTKSMQTKTDKLTIYQMMFHLWGNKNTTNKFNGSAEENGVTKFKDVNDLAIQKLKQFGYSHLYMTGLLEHATMEDFTAFGIPKDHPDVVKGRCGSPYAVKDYYDVNLFLQLTPKKESKNLKLWLAEFIKMA
jgi:hypothetical protein